QPADRRGLEILAAGRVHPGRPPRWYVCAHLVSIPANRTHILSRSAATPAASLPPPPHPRRGQIQWLWRSTASNRHGVTLSRSQPARCHIEPVSGAARTDVGLGQDAPFVPNATFMTKSASGTGPPARLKTDSG